MPTNIGDAPLTGLQIGQAAVSKGYVGIDQIFPNEVEITAAAFDNASITNAAQNTDYTVSGEIGATFTLVGSNGATGPAGTQVLAASPTTYSIAITDNSGCGVSGRSPQIVINPQGSTVLASGLSNTDTISQAGGTANQANTWSWTTSVTNLVYNTITVGGQLRWANGAKWSVSHTLNSGTNLTLAQPFQSSGGYSSQALDLFINTNYGDCDNFGTPSSTPPISTPDVGGKCTGRGWTAGWTFMNNQCSSWWTGCTWPTGTYSYDFELNGITNSNFYPSYIRFFLRGMAPYQNTTCQSPFNNTGEDSGNLYP